MVVRVTLNDSMDQHTSRATEPLLTVSEVAEWLCVSTGWVRDHANAGRRPVLPSIKLGEGKRAARRFRREDIETFIQHCHRG